MKANARIDVNPTKPGDTWQTIAEFSAIGTAYEVVNAIAYSPDIDRVRIMERTQDGARWTCYYNRPAENIRRDQEQKQPQEA